MSLARARSTRSAPTPKPRGLRRGARCFALRGARAGFFLALTTWSVPAHAGNEAHVRTPVLWPTQCARVVERDLDPVLRLDYSIPVEDTELTPDELPDSRTHQFIALCRQHPYSELLPAWITRDDVERSVAAGLIEADSVSAREILDESTSWTDCFTRITADDDRRPIEFAVAEAGVLWDTSGLAPGVWSLAGYTFEPSFNSWSDRPGFVKIVDTREDPDQDLPALALLNTEQAQLDVGAPLEIEACVDLLGPGRIEFEWAPFAPLLDWQPLDSVDVSEDGALAFDLRAPVEAAGQEILVRGRLIDAQDREYAAHAPARIVVADCSPMGCAEPPGDEDGSPLTPSGCNIVSGGGSAPLGGGLGLLILLFVCPRLGQRGRMGRQNIGSTR